MGDAVSATLLGEVSMTRLGLAVFKNGQRWDSATALVFNMQMGRLQIQDIGKRVYYDPQSRAYTMENNEQRNIRKTAEFSSAFTSLPEWKEPDGNVYSLNQYRK